jgi:DNA-binding Xre family transcriptional regulator
MSNRIRELRIAAGLSQAELAEAASMSSAQISRLENGERTLNVPAMQAIAQALNCAPEDLIAYAAMLPGRDEVVPAVMPGPAHITRSMKSKGVSIYTVQANSVAEAGIEAGATILVDETPEAIANIATGRIVLCEINNTEVKVLRQFLRPNLLVTNKKGSNLAVRQDDPSAGMKIVGVVMQD